MLTMVLDMQRDELLTSDTIIAYLNEQAEPEEDFS